MVTECERQCWLTGWTSFLPGYPGQPDGLLCLLCSWDSSYSFPGTTCHKCCGDHISLPFPSPLATLSTTPSRGETTWEARMWVREFVCVCLDGGGFQPHPSSVCWAIRRFLLLHVFCPNPHLLAPTIFLPPRYWFARPTLPPLGPRLLAIRA